MWGLGGGGGEIEILGCGGWGVVVVILGCGGWGVVVVRWKSQDVGVGGWWW